MHENILQTVWPSLQQLSSCQMNLNMEVTAKTYQRAILQMAEMAKMTIPLPNSQAKSEKFPGISLIFLNTPP